MISPAKRAKVASGDEIITIDGCLIGCMPMSPMCWHGIARSAGFGWNVNIRRTPRNTAISATDGTDEIAAGTGSSACIVGIRLMLTTIRRTTWNCWDWRERMVSVRYKVQNANVLDNHTKKGRIRMQMAEAVMKAHHSGRVRAAIGRASDFIGPEYELLGELVVYPALEGKPVNLLGKLDVPHSFTYVPDFGKALATLGARDEALGQVWIAPTPPPLTQRELMDMFSEAMDRPLKMRAASTLMVRLLGVFNPTLHESVEMMYGWEKPYVVDSSKFERAFGMSATPMRKAVQETVAWFRSRLAEV